jgi:GNAT superfamily N-acetyltransferase
VVAFEHSDVNFLYGFISGDTSESVPAVYYVYIKEPYRRGGIATRLFEALGVRPTERFTYACRTAIVPTLSRSIPAARFNPAILRYPKDRGTR